MKTIIAASVIAVLSSSAALANGGSFITPDITQLAEGVQNALNKIDDATKLVDGSQSAVNAKNLISLRSDAIQNIDDITQKAQFGDQRAENLINFKYSIDSNAMKKVNGVDVLVPYSQSATNIANSVDLIKVGGTLNQYSKLTQTALNTADSFKYPYHSNIWDFEQVGVNATNLATLSAIPTGSEIYQTAVTQQFGTNLIDANGALTNVTQSVTNVANSISLPAPVTPVAP